MKGLVLITLWVALCSVTVSAQRVDVYLSRYKRFLNGVESLKSVTPHDYQRIDSVYEILTDEYHTTYKAKMTNEQLSTYTAYRIRYKKKMAFLESKKLTEAVDTTGNVITKAVRKSGAKVSGFLKGLFGKDK